MKKVSDNKESKSRKFICYMLELVSQNKGTRAALTRADNPATEYQSWEYLARWCDLENDRERIAYATVIASLARAKVDADGSDGIGRALARSYKDGSAKNGADNDSAKIKMRRLLACRTTQETCMILRPLLRFIASKDVVVDHAILLEDLLYFTVEKTLPRWAKQFYGFYDAGEET